MYKSNINNLLIESDFEIRPIRENEMDLDHFIEIDNRVLNIYLENDFYPLSKLQLTKTYAIFLGINTTKISEGHAEGEIILRDEHFNPIKSVHGGCIFSLADTIAGSASISYGKKTATLSSNMNFISAAMDTEKIIAYADVTKRGKKVIVVSVDVTDDKLSLIHI